MKVGVALSGGKDSSLAAALLLEQGHEVVGYHLLLCPDEYALIPPEKQLAAVKDVARLLGIKLRIIDARKEFSREIIEEFLEAYWRGETPNPCVLCNAKLKFGLLLQKVLEDGCEKLASGHYARVVEGKRCLLKRSIDPERDESYFLFQLTQEQLSHLLFPLGEKTQVDNQRLLEKLLPALTPLPPTQEACFLARTGLKEFLAENLSLPSRAGEIVNEQGEKLGEHPGYQYYTVGQRKGLSSASGKKGPLFVIRVIPEENQVVVGSKEDLLASRLIAARPNWVSIPAPGSPLRVQAKIRYTHPAVEAIVRSVNENKVEVEFSHPQEAITPGQAVVFYQGEKLLGGAWIEESL